MCTLQSLSPGISEQPAQLLCFWRGKLLPKLHAALGKEQHPLRNAKRWVTGCEPRSSPPKPGEAAASEAACVQDLPCPASRGLPGTLRAGRQSPEHIILGTLAAGRSRHSPPAPPTPPPAPHGTSVQKDSQAALVHSRTFPLPLAKRKVQI